MNYCPQCATPPATGTPNGTPARRAATRGEFGGELFRDPIHLKATGAQLFTPRLAALLRPLVLGSGKAPDGSR